MKRGVPWIACVALVVVGFGAGYLARGEGADASGSGEPPLLDVAPGDAPPAATEEGLRVDAPTLEGTGHADPLAQAVLAVPSPKVEAGTGVIEGSVLDEEGNPLAGAKVTLTPSSKGRSFYPKQRAEDPDAQLVERVRGMVAQHCWTHAHRQVVETDAAGRFRFERLADAEHRVYPQLDGYQIRAKDPQAARAAKPGVTLEFLAKAMGRLRIEVDGVSPLPERVTVSTQTSNRSSSRGLDLSSPVLTLEPGVYEVNLHAGENRELRAGPYTVELSPGEPVLLRATLVGKPVLKLRLLFPEGEEMSVRTFLMRVSGHSLPEVSVLMARGQSDTVHRRQSPFPGMGSDAGPPTQVFSDLTEGTYAIGVARGWNGPIVHMELVELGAGLLEHDLEVPPLDPRDYIVVNVRLPSGKAAHGVNINTGWFREGSSSSGGSASVSRSDGSLLVLHHSTRGVAETGGTHWISATVNGFGTKRVAYDREKTRAITIDLEEPARLELQVKGIKGTAYENRVAALLQVVSKQGGHSSYGGSTDLDVEGKTTLAGLQPGRYELILSLSSGSMGSSQVHKEALTLDSGPNRLTTSLPTLYTLTVRGVSGSAWISSQDRTIHFHENRSADKDGVVVFEGIPAGSYQIQGAGKSAAVTLPGPAEVTLKPR